MARTTENGDMYAPTQTELTTVNYNRTIALKVRDAMQQEGIACDAFPTFVVDELYFRSGGRLFDPKRQQIDLEAVDIENDFTADAGRWVREYVKRAESKKKNRLQARCVRRVMWVDFALTSRAMRLGRKP